MAKISTSAGQSDDAKRFDVQIIFFSNMDNFLVLTEVLQATSKQLVSQWTPLALASDNSHLLANFEQSSSSAIIYNLFADRWLQLDAVPDAVYDAQTRSVASCKLNVYFEGAVSQIDSLGV
jgi:hypothetical protein